MTHKEERDEKKHENIIRKFFNYCREKRIPRAMLKSIPYVGASFDELVYGGDLELLIRHIHAETIEKQNEIIDNLNALMEPVAEKTVPIVVFGSGNSEHVLYHEGDLELGFKYPVKSIELFGGGGVNYTLRLLAAGHEVFPILSIGKDRIGYAIQQKLLTTARKAQVSTIVYDFINQEDFFVPGIKTAHATVLVHGNRRTIFSQELYGAENYKEYLQKRISDIDRLLGKSPSAVLIGHIYCDGLQFCSGSRGECSKIIIEAYSGRCPILVNFGTSQLDLRYDFWKEILKSVTSIQFNLVEARRFFEGSSRDISLSGLLDFLAKENITSIITIDRFGAVGNYRNGCEGITLAWPLIEFNEIKDPTGAGDAFAAGMVSYLKSRENITFHDFYASIEIGRTWAAFACTTLGGSADCPDIEKLLSFLKETDPNSRQPIEIQSRHSAEQIMKLIDLARR